MFKNNRTTNAIACFILSVVPLVYSAYGFMNGKVTLLWFVVGLIGGGVSAILLERPLWFRWDKSYSRFAAIVLNPFGLAILLLIFTNLAFDYILGATIAFCMVMGWYILTSKS